MPCTLYTVLYSVKPILDVVWCNKYKTNERNERSRAKRGMVKKVSRWIIEVHAIVPHKFLDYVASWFR